MVKVAWCKDGSRGYYEMVMDEKEYFLKGEKQVERNMGMLSAWEHTILEYVASGNMKMALRENMIANDEILEVKVIHATNGEVVIRVTWVE